MLERRLGSAGGKLELLKGSERAVITRNVRSRKEIREEGEEPRRR
jgi:hypothetical protein